MAVVPTSSVQINQLEVDRAATIELQARQQMSNGVSSRTVDAAFDAIMAATEATRVGGYRAVATDMDRLETAARAYLAEDMRQALSQLTNLLTSYVTDGYTYDLTLRAKMMNSMGDRQYEVQVTDADRAALSSYPILGHTAAGIALHLTSQLNFEAWRAMSAPLNGQTAANYIYSAIDVANARFAAQAAGWAANAMWSGVQAAQLEMISAAYL